MKKTTKIMFIVFATLLFMTGCTETVSKDEKGNVKTEFSFNETANVNNTKIKINSVKKIMSECYSEYDGKCYGETTPDNDFFLVIDLTIENKGKDELGISSMMSFDLKDANGERGSYALLTKSVSSQLDGGVMSNDLLKGQIAYDVKDTEKYYFYYKDSLLDSNIKFTINKSDIIQ